MRILIAGVTYYPAANGQARATVNLAEGMARHGHSVMMLTPSDRKVAFTEIRHGVYLRGLKSFKVGFIQRDSYYSLFYKKAIQSLMDEFQPDIVHIQDHYPFTRYVAVAAIKRGIKAVGSNHFMPENVGPFLPGYTHLKRIFDWLLWKWMLETYNRLDAVITPSKTAANLLRAQKLRPPVFAISGGINLDRFRPEPSVDRSMCRVRYGLDTGRTIFLFVGRIDKEKRLDVILQALHKLERDDIQLCVTGIGAAQDGLKKIARDLNLKQRVHFTGFVPNEDLPCLINSCDIFVMPSEAELLSIASLEAMACRRPILAARAVALPELVSDGLNGYLFTPGDASDAAHCIEKLVDHPELWAEMGAASLERVKSHSLEAVMRRNEALYEIVLTGNDITLLEKSRRKVRKKKKSKESQHISSA